MYVIFTKVALLLCNLSPLNAKRSKSNMQVNVCKEEITLFVCLCFALLCFALLGFSLCFFSNFFRRSLLSCCSLWTWLLRIYNSTRFRFWLLWLLTATAIKSFPLLVFRLITIITVSVLFHTPMLIKIIVLQRSTHGMTENVWNRSAKCLMFKCCSLSFG